MSRMSSAEITTDTIDEYVESVRQEYVERGIEPPPRRMEHAQRLAERMADRNERMQQRRAAARGE